LNTKRRNFISFLKSKFTIRVWLAIMLLVAVSIAFLWTIQLGLFERSYIDAAVNEMENRVEPIIEDIDSYGMEEAVSYISAAVHGKVFLLDGDGDLLYAYGIGLPAVLDEVDESMMHYFSENLEQVLAGQDYEQLIRDDRQDLKLAQGIPANYKGQNYAIFTFTYMDEISAMQVVNLQQLFVLSVALAVAAGFLAFLLARHLVKPLKTIEKAVNRMTEGDLTAKPGLTRSDELGQLSDSVEKLGISLQRVDVLRKEVIANVSHELRAPLSVIIGYSEMVRDISGKDETKRTEHMDLIIQEAERLSRMVSDIMDYSQFQSGYIVLKKSETDLYALVESEVIYARKVAAPYRISILLENGIGAVSLYLDPIKMSQVLRNLLNNAINNTKDGETITVSIARQNSVVRAEVKNPGPAIPPEEQEIIWERYRKSQHQGSRREGTGIGLSIVSTILEAHGIKYGVESANGTNTFWFEINQ
jgi:signal transduction histidine kinase